MTDNFKNPADFVRDHPTVRTAERRAALLRIYRRGTGNGVDGVAFGPFWIENCLRCNGHGKYTVRRLWIFREQHICEACDGIGRVICGDIDQTRKPEYGIHGYDADQAGQQESKRLNEWPPA